MTSTHSNTLGSPSHDPAEVERLRMTRRFDTSPERVFDAWLISDTAHQWLLTSPANVSSTVEIDARTGGAWLIVDRQDGEEFEFTGEYLEIDRPHRLVFICNLVQFDLYTQVTVEIVPEAGGSCLTFTQERVPLEGQDETAAGWHEMFNYLAATLAA